MLDVGGDADPLAVGEHPDQRQLDVAQQRGAASTLEVLVEGHREVGGSLGVQGSVGGAGEVALVVEGQLVAGILGAQLAPQVAQ